MPSKLVMMTWNDDDGGADFPARPSHPINLPPNYPSTGPVYPGHRPDNTLPQPGHPVHLPVFPFDPTAPVGPDNSLPSTPGVPTHPIQIVPGARFVVKWLACQGLILVPDNTLPETPEPK